ncbi:MAG: inorganic pyrophosphatase [Oscillospiraceae bacterium]|nr:inorganic pyrophosphatase [Oscillospiraceae bacterium]
MIGQTVKVTIDRPLGSFHPNHPDIYYPVNYGYVEGIIAPDGEEQDVYVLGVDEPLKEFIGRVIAVIHRFDDVEEKWVAAPENVTFTKEEIMEQVRFQERFFKSEVRMK